MSNGPSLLEELRTQYEAARKSSHEHADVPGYQEIDAQLRKAFRWLEKAVAYLDELKPPIEHRFDIGHGLVFESPRFKQGSIGQHEGRVLGYPVLDEINIYYEISASKPLALDVAPGVVEVAEKALDEAGLQYTSRRVEDPHGAVRKCAISVPPTIPAAVSLRADYKTGKVTVTLVNVDRLDRLALEFQSSAIDEPALEDLVRLILGRDSAFLRRGRLAFHPRPSTVV